VSLLEGPLSLLQVAAYVAFAATTLAFIASFVRVVKGPSLADRVLALDMIGLVSVSLIATYAIASQQALFLDAALALALIAFLGTVAFARFIEWRSRRDHG
jgi:multicomponent Na+:H+ antiporter subunit F